MTARRHSQIEVIMAAWRLHARRLAALLAVLGFAPAVGALGITGLAVERTGANTPNDLVDSGNDRAQLASSTSIVGAPSGPVPDTSGSSIAFQTRFASLLAVDGDGIALGTVNRAMTSAYEITFTVDNPSGQTYRIDIDTLRVGALTNVDDSLLGNGTQTLGAVTGSVDAVVNGALALAAVGPLTSSSTGTMTFNQSGTTLSITDSALSRTLVLSFNWISSASSARDEAAIRMGTAGSLSTATADNYPGEGNRTAAGDGHFATITTTMIPEPQSSALLVLGLVGLGIRKRLNCIPRSRR